MAIHAILRGVSFVSTDSTVPRKSGAGRLFGWGIVLLILIAVVYTYGTLSYKYSEGERAGLLQKFSSKGWVCKTYEGELALYVVAGIQPEIWHFSVRDPAVAAQMAKAVGQRVQLHYSEHPGVPTSCFGESAYFVDRINSIGELPAMPGTATSSPTALPAVPPAAATAPATAQQ